MPLAAWACGLQFVDKVRSSTSVTLCMEGSLVTNADIEAKIHSLPSVLVPLMASGKI